MKTLLPSGVVTLHSEPTVQSLLMALPYQNLVV